MRINVLEFPYNYPKIRFGFYCLCYIMKTPSIYNTQIVYITKKFFAFHIQNKHIKNSHVKVTVRSGSLPNYFLSENHYKNCPNFGLKVIKITTKSYLDKNHYLIFPQSLKITMILGPLVGPLGPNQGSYRTTRTPARGALEMELCFLILSYLVPV